MMRRLKINLDTSVINFLFADDAPELQKITKEFFDKFVKLGIYDVYVSDIVIDEISSTKDSITRKKLLGIIKDYDLNYLSGLTSEEVISLAQAYIDNNIFTKKSLADSFHVSISVINKMDILLSWNFKHLANINRESKIIEFNNNNNYHINFRILTPMEVLSYENL